MQVVPVHGDVQAADDLRRVDARLGGRQPGRETERERQAASGDAQEHDVGGAPVPLEDLVRDPGECSGDVAVGENEGGSVSTRVAVGIADAGACAGHARARGHLATSFPASPDGS